jgi:2,5-diamino-6-(ribosylamino)-4(3H)-pyrimidinone 5'-phosphate reductase
MSVDGKLALPIRKQTKISSKDDMDRVYRLRHQCDAVLVGVGTILADDPGLVVKFGGELADNQPLRVVLDTQGRTPEDAEVLDDRAPTLIAVGEGCIRDWGETETVVCGRHKINLEKLLSILADRGIKKVLVEGGGETLWSFISQKLVDELYVFMGNMVIGGAGSPTMADGEGARTIDDIVGLELIESKEMDGGLLLHYKLRQV